MQAADARGDGALDSCQPLTLAGGGRGDELAVGLGERGDDGNVGRGHGVAGEPVQGDPRWRFVTQIGCISAKQCTAVPVSCKAVRSTEQTLTDL